MSGEIPGQVAKHAIVTDECRANRSDLGAFDEASARLREEYTACLVGWAGVEGVRFHVVLTVERPSRKPVPEEQALDDRLREMDESSGGILYDPPRASQPPTEGETDGRP